MKSPTYESDLTNSVQPKNCVDFQIRLLFFVVMSNCIIFQLFFFFFCCHFLTKAYFFPISLMSALELALTHSGPLCKMNI